MKKQAVIGIDPGKTGAACLLAQDLEIEFFRWPKDNDLMAVHKIIKCWNASLDIKGAILEKVHSMPGQGVKSVFTFGTNNGQWEMVLTVNKITFFRPTPREWQKGLVRKSDGETPKARSFAVASRLFPRAKLKGPNGGIQSDFCDALLMAWFGFNFYKLTQSRFPQQPSIRKRIK